MQKKKRQVLKTVASGAGIIFFGSLFAYFANFIYQIIISRYLGPADYGLISLGQMVLNVGMILSLLGLNEGLVRYSAYYLGRKNVAKIKGVLLAVLKITIPASILVTFLLVFFSKFIAIQIFKNAEFIPILIVFALIIPIHVLLRIIAQFFLALKKPGYNQFIRVIFRNMVNIILVLAVVLIGGNVFQVSLAYLISVVVSAIFGIVLLECKIFPILRNKIKPFYNYKKLIMFSLPLLFTGVFLKIMGWADTFFIGFFKTAAEVGVYNVAFPVAAAMGMFLAAFGTIFYPIISELLGKKERFEIGHIFEVIMRWIFAVTFPIFLLILLFPKDILKIMFGKAYVAGSTALLILTAAYFINVITGPGVHTLKAFKKVKFIFYLNFGIVILNLVLNILLIPWCGITGAAIATGISIGLREIIIFFKVKRLIKFSYNIKYYIKYILSAAIPLLVIYWALNTFFQSYYLITVIIALAVFVAIYLFLLLLLKSFSKEDLVIIRALEKKSGLNLKFIKSFIKHFI
ncbi:flippase [Candidatus Woesearchaeota archaeon]|nr:flippase [Candidatus Woesearchaeota archaeon]